MISSSGTSVKLSPLRTPLTCLMGVPEGSGIWRKEIASPWTRLELDQDLNLLYDQVKMVRGMEGYGWFANTIFHDKDEPKKQYAIDFWFKPEGDDLKLMDIRIQKGPKQEGDGYVMVTRMPVAWWG